MVRMNMSKKTTNRTGRHKKSSHYVLRGVTCHMALPKARLSLDADAVLSMSVRFFANIFSPRRSGSDDFFFYQWTFYGLPCFELPRANWPMQIHTNAGFSFPKMPDPNADPGFLFEYQSISSPLPRRRGRACCLRNERRQRQSCF